MQQVTIIGGGLAGSEAAWQLVNRGIAVHLYEMRPTRTTRAHKTGQLAELVCSNSFRGADLSNAVGLLKEELRLFNSLIMEAAQFAAVPAGGALAVDRDRFSDFVHDRLINHPLVTVSHEEIAELPPYSVSSPLIIATGPLTSPALASELVRLTDSEQLAFYDAISPIITIDSIDQSKVFRQSRYMKGDGDDYLNIPLNKEQYERFVSDVLQAEKFTAHSDIDLEPDLDLRPFEGCMPIEDMIERGPETLRFGPFKPVGLTDPNTGDQPHAVCQLRQDNKEGTLWSMVGVQTRMKHPEQLRIFRELPGLERAEFVRLGSMHRNTFLNSPKCIAPTLQFRDHPGLFIAGQISGVEGYVESTAGGLTAGINCARLLEKKDLITFPRTTALGGLVHYISDPERKDFQPMNISFGLIDTYFDLNSKKLPKKERRMATSRRALETLREIGAMEQVDYSSKPSR